MAYYTTIGTKMERNFLMFLTRNEIGAILELSERKRNVLKQLEGDKMNISTTKIETMLAERGMTRTALAELSGISRQNISTIIRRGTCEPKTAGKLAAGLGVPVTDILEGARA